MKIRIFNFLSYWLPIITYCAFIFIQSSYPVPDDLPQFRFGDKGVHFLAYALLGALFLRAYRRLKIGDNLHLITLLSALSAGIYGLSDEFHQHFVPSRNADVLDAIADMIGSIAGAYFYRLLITEFPKRSRKQEKQN